MIPRFHRDQIANFDNSFNFLLRSLLGACEFLDKNRDESKQNWLFQTQKFVTFYEKIKGQNNSQLIENLKETKIVPLYKSHDTYFISNVVEDDKIRDLVVKIQKDDSSIQPRGLKIELTHFYLPISEIYTDIVSHAIKNPKKTIPYPMRILVGLFSTIYHSIIIEEEEEKLALIKKNIDSLVEYMEASEFIPKQESMTNNPMSFLGNMMKKFDSDGKFSEMFNKVSGDKNASNEFTTVLDKLGKGMQNGGNFMDVVGDIVKDISVDGGEGENGGENIVASEKAMEQE